MPEPFKNQFNKKTISNMAKHFKRSYSAFNAPGFIRQASKNLDQLELKQRSTQIQQAMSSYLPHDFNHAADILVQSLAPDDCYLNPDKSAELAKQGITGWAILPMSAYVAEHGLKNFSLSMSVLKAMTGHFSSEFGIRFFIKADLDRSLKILHSWLSDPNFHVRRLISEGTRPRLPWAMQLPALIKDPSPIIPLLETLKNDTEEYVRRSVANNLNDISKDHPDLIATIAKTWRINADKNREKLIKHACRSLIKQGHKKTLKALGYSEPKVELKTLKIINPKLKFGNALEFEIKLSSNSQNTQQLIIDYVIHHRKANGSTSPKVFKWKTISLKAAEDFSSQRKHPIKKITTRVYYPGRHQLEIQVNGKSLGIKNFTLIM